MDVKLWIPPCSPSRSRPHLLSTTLATVRTYIDLQRFKIELIDQCSYVNTLNTNLISNIRALAKVPIRVRVGGSSQNLIHWAAGQTQAVINTFPDGSDTASRVDVGPAFFDAFTVWPNDTEYTFGMAISTSGSAVLPDALALTQQAYKVLGSRLYAISMGNQKDQGEFKPLQT
jgi:hypothetical protein